jgi:hypothetical protein
MAVSAERARGNVLTWPFHQEHWLGSLWIPLLWWIFIPPIVFPLGTVPAIGWVLDAAARRGRQDSRLLPESRDLGRMIKYGLIFAAVGLLYFVILPLVFYAALFLNEQYANKQLSDVMAQSIQWGYAFVGHAFFGTPSPDFSTISNQYARLAREEEIVTLASTLVAGLYIVLVVPLFAAGTVRFALTGKARSFFHIFGNLGLFLTHLGGFLKFFFLYFVIGAVLAWLTFVFAVTVVIPIVLVASGFWITAYLAGNLAHGIWQSSEKIRAAAGASAPSAVVPGIP